MLTRKMKQWTRAAALAVALTVSAAATLAAHADTIALTFTGVPSGTSVLTRGWAFSTSNNLTVTSLGWWDFDDNGLLESHQVGIWDTSGNLLMSVTVSAGTTDPLESGFRFNSALTGTPTLAPGTYVIGGLAGSSDLVADQIDLGNLTVAPGIAFIENRVAGTTGFAFPGNSQAGLDAGTFGPTFQFAGTPVIPEPAAFATIALAALIVVHRRRPASPWR